MSKEDKDTPTLVVLRARRSLKKLARELQYDPNTLVSTYTLSLAKDLTESIKADKKEALAAAKQLEINKKTKWPFPPIKFNHAETKLSQSILEDTLH